MNFSDLIEGERVLIKIGLSDGTFSINTYSSKVEKSPSPGHINICSPTAGDMKHWVGKKVKLFLTRDNACYSCIAEVIEQKYENLVFLILVKELTDFEKIQRRAYYRLKIELKVVLVNIGSAKAIDISGSGISLKSKRQVEKNENISGVINLHKEFIRFKGSVVSCELVTQDDDEQPYYIIRAKYVDLDPRDQDKIVKFVLDQQVLQRLKRLNMEDL